MIKLTSLILSAICIASTSCSTKSTHSVQIERDDDGFAVTFDGNPFTRYIQGEQKAFLYPVIGPTGINMSRNYPMKPDIPGESQDHPWHVGIFYSHGSINGLDFWNERLNEHANYRIELLKIEKSGNLSPEKAQLVVSNKWTRDHSTIMTDRTEITFSGDDSKRIIDYKVTLIASHGDVLLGDTKQGCMAIRMNDKFRSKDQNAKVINSEGVSGKSVWGKKARWVTYYNEIEGETLGISLFDHPTNLRYPTPWHARDYGLFGANAFGLSEFMPGEGVSGDLILKAGESISFYHRFIFHTGTPQEAKINDLHSKWINQ